MKRTHPRSLLILACCCGLLGAAGGGDDLSTQDNRNPKPTESSPFLAPIDDLPVSRANPVAGDIETVDTYESRGFRNVRHVVELNPHTTMTFLVSGDLVDDLAPRLGINSEGLSWTIWWRDLESDQVLYRRLDRNCCWSRIRRLSGDLEDARNPEIAVFGDAPWVSYETTDPSGTSIHVGVIHDEPDPFGLSSIATTGYDGNLDSLIETDTEHLWLSWLVGDQVLAWSAYDPALDLWSEPQTLAFAGSSIVEARDELQSIVTGGGE